MIFSYSPKVQELQQKLHTFMEDYIYQNEHAYEAYVDEQTDRWATPSIIEELKEKAKEQDWLSC